MVGARYREIIKKPWRKLKREKLGGNNRPFHATEFGQRNPTLAQISAISRFLSKPFWRFAVMSDSRTELPSGVDGHQAVSLVTRKFISTLVASMNVENVALVFEASSRGDALVKRDFPLTGLVNARGHVVPVDGYLMPKASMEAGLEVADLVAHTAGRQRRHQLTGKAGATKDFKQMYWHSRIPPAFMSIDTMTLDELAVEG